MATNLEQLTKLGLILKRPIAPFILKILHYSQVALSRQELLERLELKFARHSCPLPAQKRIDEDLNFLFTAKLIALEPMVSLTEDGRRAALELFKEATATTSQ